MAYIERLSNEILKDILDQIDSQKTIPIDRREYLSVESFKPPPPLPSQAQDIGNFRLSCRRFAELGIPYQFTRVTLRFSSHGFQRLARICNHSHLAKHTKKFSYLVPLFYGDGIPVDDFVRSTRNSSNPYVTDYFHPSDAVELRGKEQDQAKIIRTKRDVLVLRDAMSAFTALQHVQVLRIENEADRRLISYLLNARHNNAPLGQPPVELRWLPACYHATKTLAEALAFAKSPFNRFSGPMMNPHSLLSVQRRIPQVIASLSSGLTCLEIHFEDGRDLDDRVLELTPCFKTVFSSAIGLQAVHIGFPTRTPLGLGLEDVFNYVQWDRLRAFGIQAWRLGADEIIDLVRRHKKTLRGLRLRDVLLKEGSAWKDVLAVLRAEMESLDWVSLRRIDYTRHFDEMSEIAKQSIEVPDDPPASGSESDEEDEFPTYINDMDVEDDSDGDQSDENSNADTDHGPDANEFALSPDTPTSMPFCTCSRSACPTNPDDLGDNGLFVTYQQRKLWEKWVRGTLSGTECTEE